MFPGQETTGLSVSLTTMLKLHPAVLPVASVAVQVTVFVTMAKLGPLGGTQTSATPGQLSVAVAAKFTTALHWPGAVLVVMSPGQVAEGGLVSLTPTPKLQPSEVAPTGAAAQGSMP